MIFFDGPTEAVVLVKDPTSGKLYVATGWIIELAEHFDAYKGFSTEITIQSRGIITWMPYEGPMPAKEPEQVRNHKQIGHIDKSVGE